MIFCMENLNKDFFILPHISTIVEQILLCQYSWNLDYTHWSPCNCFSFWSASFLLYAGFTRRVQVESGKTYYQVDQISWATRCWWEYQFIARSLWTLLLRKQLLRCGSVSCNWSSLYRSSYGNRQQECCYWYHKLAWVMFLYCMLYCFSVLVSSHYLI